jgi:hypothetical protein
MSRNDRARRETIEHRMSGTTPGIAVRGRDATRRFAIDAACRGAG